MKKVTSKAKPAAPKRKRKAVNLTLSELAREQGEALAAARGVRLSQIVEQLIRRELRSVGRIPAEDE